ncbi:MAG TPA: tRNA preQ1(34) S-adenosylmethionine ribosyltransferase-isomerase QueA [Chloroflexota bacterium]|nr:tRNA preQ1(34) S-adenosylmethionine ribosyltransferase-isomerase QueA [Chloroflexota bacterium]
MRTDDFDYHLPPELIAQTPVEPRDASRLLVIHRDSGQLEHRRFREIGEFLRPGDLLIANDSRVLPGRLFARKPTGGRVELLLLRELPDGRWESLARPANRLHPGQLLLFDNGGVDTAEVGERTESGAIALRFTVPASEILARHGHVPLPPYIKAPLGDPERYQTVYGRVAGSAAAPTAGLHFTPALMEALAERGVGFGFVTLHVGLDTFRPVQAERVADHQMHAELVVVPDQTAAAIRAARAAGGRIVAVGTTAVRSLESWAAAGGEGGWSGWTRLFIYPGYVFRAVDALITNFHLPRSTLLMLVSAFASRALMRRAYDEAIAREYRFFSFGDATLIL